MKVRFTPRARLHLDNLADYISQRNPDAARRVGERIRETIDLLADFPLIGHAGVLSDTKEMVVPGLPYVVVYRLEPGENILTILGIYHGAQLRPGQTRR